MGKLSFAAVTGLLTLSLQLPAYAMVPGESGFTPDMPLRLFDCSTSLIKLIASSDQALIQAEKVPADKLEINIEPRDNGIQAIELFDVRHKPSADSPGAGRLGWVMYDTQSGKLMDNSADEQHPRQLTFNPLFGQQYQQCLQKEQRCRTILSQMKLGPVMADSPKWLVIGKGRAYFHAAPTEQCIDEGKFVIPGDVAQIVGYAALEPVKGEKNDYVLVAYGKASGWINAERLAPLDVFCQNTSAEAGNFLAKAVSPEEIYKVSQKKLYFYDAPESACQQEEQRFVILGDNVTVDSVQIYKGYLHGSYINPRSGEITTGWLKAEGLVKQ